MLAKFILTADQFSKGRAAVNVVIGWFKNEYTDLGLPWLEHDERYRRSAEFIEMLRGLWTDRGVDFAATSTAGRFQPATGPFPVEGREHPEIFQGGNSTAARFNGGAHADWYFSNGKDFDGFTEQYDDVTASRGRTTAGCGFGLNGSPSSATARPRPASSCARSSRTPTCIGRSVPRLRAAGGGLDGRQEGHVGRLVVRRPRAIQRRFPHATHRRRRAGRAADHRVQAARRRPRSARLPALHEEVEQFGEKVLPIVRSLEANLLRTGTFRRLAG